MTNSVQCLSVVGFCEDSIFELKELLEHLHSCGRETEYGDGIQHFGGCAAMAMRRIGGSGKGEGGNGIYVGDVIGFCGCVVVR
jgi:hypothetical protein